jgi:hypothetical protein
MKLEKLDDKYIFSDLDSEMVQLIINGLNCERKRLLEKKSYLSTYIYRDFSDKQKEEFSIQFEYLKNKNIELTEKIKIISEEFERIII